MLACNRPADNATGKQIEQNGKVEPAFRRSEYVKSASHLWFMPLIGEGTIQHVAGNDGVVARVDRASPSTRSGSEALLTHQPFDPVQATNKNFCKHIAADKARTLSPVAHQKTFRDTAAKHCVTFAPL